MSSTLIRTLPLLLLVPACATPGSSLSAHRDARPLYVEVEAGPLWQTRNDVRIPGDTGTRFSMSDLIGEDAGVAARVTADWNIDSHHSVRAVIAPINFNDTGTFDQPANFDGQAFAAGVPTQGTYKFSSYRLGYRYTYLHDEHWRLRVGGTLFVRDAKIQLEQAGVNASDSDVGIVPLLNLSAEYYPAKDWRIVSELDGLASGQGRAFDFTIKGLYDVSENCSVGLGYRTIEGGADNDDVFNFAWLHSLTLSVGVGF